MKIAIVGAGPAGAFCAYRLGQAGVDVTLYDKNDAWEKPCGGGVPPKLWQKFEEIRDAKVPCNEVGLGVFVSPAYREVELVSGNPMRVYSRKQFDGYLRSLALSQKTVAFRRERLLKVERPKKRWRVVTDSSRELYDLVIGADGALSRVRRYVSTPIPKQHMAVTGGYFVQKSGVDRARTQFLEEGGYMWAFPRLDHVCVGGGAGKDGWNIFEGVEVFRKRYFPDEKILSKWGASIPFVKDPKFYDLPITGDGWALVGDAAGHVDAITGEGIYYAVVGADLLAAAIVEGNLSRYEEAWRDEYGLELKKAAQMSRVFYGKGYMERIFWIARRSRSLREFLMDIMTNQPSYLQTGNMFRKRLPRIVLEVAGILK